MEVWPLEVNVHVLIRSTQCSVEAIDVHWIRIEFALGNSVTEPVWIQIQCGQAFRQRGQGNAKQQIEAALMYVFLTFWSKTHNKLWIVKDNNLKNVP